MCYEPKLGDLKTLPELLALEELPTDDIADYDLGGIFYGRSGCGWIVGSKSTCVCFDDE